MKRFSIFAILMLMAVATACARGKKVLILHTNDTHSCVMPIKPTISDTLIAGRGGYLRRLAMVRQERKADPKLLLLDSGDFSQGSPYYGLFRGEVEVGLMNRMGYDAATIGNHEFDNGLENMARLFRMAAFPIVCANYDFTGTPVEGLVKPYVVIKRYGLRIGVFGLAPKLDGLVQADNCQGVKYLDPISVAKDITATLRDKERCDLVICLSHLGLSKNEECPDQMMMQNTNGIDIVLGGHSHTFLKDMLYFKNTDGVMVPNDQNGKSGIFVGRIVLDMEKR